jgi:predicted RNA-binding Zn ribbon-like protein
MSPRYDVPRAAPEPLRQVQLFVNSVDREHDVEWLPEWLAEHGIAGEAERACELREALRALLLANNGGRREVGSSGVLDRAAERLRVRLAEDGRPELTGEDALDRVVAVALEAMLDGSWSRLKACRTCRWAFYDYSRNRSATWCSMLLCGNRTKTRAYRLRRSSEPR